MEYRESHIGNEAESFILKLAEGLPVDINDQEPKQPTYEDDLSSDEHIELGYN